MNKVTNKKKKKHSFWVGLSVVIFMLICVSGIVLYSFPISLGGHSITVYEDLDSDVLLSAEEVSADVDRLIELVESVHPAFVDGSDLSQYEQAKKKFIQSTGHDMTVREFRYEVCCYLSVFHDGHTRLWWSDTRSFAIYHSYADQKMYYYSYENGEALPTGLYITAINDIPTEHIFELIECSMPAENEYALRDNYNNYFTSESILKLAGVEIQGDFVEVSLSDGSKEKCSYFVPTETENNGNTFEEGNRWSWDGEIFVVTFEACHYDKGFRDAVRELEKAVDNGCSKVIIDVRNNGGGDSKTCVDLLKAMGMKAPKFGSLIRYSQEAQKQRGYIRSKGTYVSKEKLSGKQNPNVDLVVLYNQNTFSSANMMCVFVRDGGLGTLIGAPCKNSPCHYGDILYFSLENSHLYGSISHVAFTRPNGNKEEKVLFPDVETVNGDPYQTAVDFLMSK